ncbi:DUF3078 domain-containing protein [Maribacter sp. MJ134]|uniref:DUF3078 domain-containing protein n=1 Tax=Maribacter sp. MJ134 TaxID=2496865 RepID=UPI000F823336|nr:DUF3078 domain-containing protein [Maribacter sp. MJ134]AZQ59526.1 DUF3078 domain-containing protein [Maribacter sp. MJ134]
MTKRITNKTVWFTIILGLAANLFFAQNTIPATTPTDSVSIDTTVVDTIVIRKTLTKIKHIPRGVNLTNPVISFKKTKPLKDRYNRFRVPSFWKKENQLGINVSETAFVNWNAGGDNAISGLGFLKFSRNYKFRYFKWDNNLDLRYGLNAQEGRKLRKTEDVIRLNSNVGYRRDTISNWYYSVQLNFNTQFSNGFKYPDRTTPISRFMAPGYLFFGAGTSYISQDQKFNLYLSPLTQKSTFVLDQRLADRGAFGVEKAVLDADGNVITPGENHLLELGFLVTHNWNLNLGKNIDLNSRLNLYTDYLASFGNIDLDWELNIKMRVNKYILTTIGTHLIYDDDILFDEVKNVDGIVTDPGEPRLQFKQVLGVGVAYDF